MYNLLCKNIVFIVFFLVLLPSQIQANCTCAPTNGSVLQGVEFISKSCPAEGDTDSTNRVYISQWIICNNGKLTKNTMFPASENFDNPAGLISKARSYNNTKILRNETGTHIIAVHRYYQGSVAGLTPPVGVTTNPNLNEYCIDGAGLSDIDQDGFSDCLDCNTTDPSKNVDCPSCEPEYIAKIVECGSEKNIKSWVEETCSGECTINPENLGPFCKPTI